MTQRFSFWEDLTIRENLRFVARMYAMADRDARVEAALDAARAHRARRPARGDAVRRLEAAPRARRVPAARAAAPAARRADGRRRPQGAARVLGRAARVRRNRHHGARQHALHGRGRALPQARVHPQRTAAGAGHGRGGRSPRRRSSAGRSRGRTSRRSRPSLRALPSVEQVAAFGERLHVIGRDAKRLDAELAPFRDDARYAGSGSNPVSRTCSST